MVIPIWVVPQAGFLGRADRNKGSQRKHGSKASTRDNSPRAAPGKSRQTLTGVE